MSNKKIIPLVALRPRKGDAAIVSHPNAFHFAIGSVLGDGSINKRDFNLEVSSASPYFALWKHKLATEFGLISIHQKKTKKWPVMLKGVLANHQLPLTVKEHKPTKTNPTEMAIEFSFVTRAVFRDPMWRNGFYGVALNRTAKKQYRKKLPSNIKELFWSDFALAIWYLDDGTYDPVHRTARISASEWTLTECVWMQDCLLSNFNIETNIYLSHGRPHHFYVRRYSYPEFYRRVMPTIRKFLKAYPEAKTCEGVRNKLRLVP